jgi:hypothetical protein
MSTEFLRKIEEMIQDAVSECETYLAAEVISVLKRDLLIQAKEMRSYYLAAGERHDRIRRRMFQLAQVWTGSTYVRSEMVRRILGQTKWVERIPTEIRLWLQSLGLEPLRPCSIR